MQSVGWREAEHFASFDGTRSCCLLWPLCHVLPNVVAPVIVISSFILAQIIITEASLSFLRLGIRPPTPAWGCKLSDSRNYLHAVWWLPTFPGLALLLTLLGINLAGDWLRDLLDPTLRSAE